MSKETKLLLEAWRKFINEGRPDEYGLYSDPDDPEPNGPPVPPDPDLTDEPFEDEDDFYA